MRLPFGTAATVQQLVQHSQGCQGEDGEDEEQEDDEAGHIPAIMERVDLLDLQRYMGERGGLWVPGEITWLYCGVARHGHCVKMSENRRDWMSMAVTEFGYRFHTLKMVER